MTTTKNRTRLLVVAAAALTAALPMTAQSIDFSFTGGTVTGIDFTGLNFNATSSYNYGSIQLRVYDLYSTSSTLMGATLAPGGLSFSIDSAAATPSSFSYTVPTSDLGGSASLNDSIGWISMSTPISFTTGQSLSLAGSASVTGTIGSPLTPPTSGTYTAYLVSQADGSLLTDPISVQVTGLSAVPEPSTWAAIAGLTALGAAWFGRWRGRKRA